MVDFNPNQLKAINTIDKNVLVKAGAGAGKTAVLTERFFKILKNSKNNPKGSELLVLTFTNKAVDELNARVIRGIGDIEGEIELNIFTFDAFFKNIVDQYSEKDYSMWTLLEEYEEQKLVFEIVKEELIRSDIFDFIISLGSFDLNEIAEEVYSFFRKYRNIYGELNYNNINYANCDEYLILENLRLFESNSYKKANKIRKFIEEKFSDCNHDYIIKDDELRELLTLKPNKGMMIYLEKYISWVDKKNVSAYESFILLLARISKAYKIKKTALFKYDYVDIVNEAFALLEGNVLFELQERFKYIMIDEFQDTSPMQLNFFKKLTSNYSLNNIFVVGDVKQSIYRFRGADFKNIIEYEKDMENLGGEIIDLDTNYRSSSNIIDFTNEAFRSNMDDYKDMISNKGKKGGIYRVDNSDLKYSELINKIVEDGYSYKDIAILSRKSSECIKIAKELKAANIPFNSSNTAPLFEVQAVRDILILLKYLLLDEYNEDEKKIDYLTILKSHILNFTDDELKFLDPSYEDEEKNSLVKRINFRLENLRNEMLGRTLVDFIDYLYIDEAYLDYYLGDGHEEEYAALIELKNSLKIILESDKNSPQYAIIRLLEDRERVVPNLFSLNEDAIRLSTIHKSKGLEYKVVILPDITGVNQIRTSRFLLQDNTLAIKFDEQGLYDYYATKYKEDEKDELNRLLYVAITRAEEAIYIIDKNITDSSIAKPIETAIDKLAEEAILNPSSKKNLIFSRSYQYDDLIIGDYIKNIAPSKQDEELIFDEVNANFGNAIHEYAELIAMDIEVNIDLLRSRYEIDDTKLDERFNRHMSNIKAFIDSRKERKIMSEKLLVSINNDALISGKIDRIEIDEDEVLIIDYKTREVKDDMDIRRAMDDYKGQLDSYREMIEDIYPERQIRCFIYFTAIGGLKEYV